MVNICILKLEDDKWYVLRSVHATHTVEDYMDGLDSDWCRLHRPIAVEDVYRDRDPADEETYVLKYMVLKGIDHVRGGSHQTVVLADEEKTALEEEIKDRCRECEETEYLLERERNRTPAPAPAPVPAPPPAPTRTFYRPRGAGCHRCFKCGGWGHFMEECPVGRRTKKEPDSFCIIL